MTKSYSTKSDSTGTIIKTIFTLIILAIDIYILVTALNMQKPEYQCKCVQKWYLKKISNTIIIIISLQIAVLLLGYNSDLTGLVSIIELVLSIIQIYYLIVMIGLIYQLYKDKCQCVDPRFKSVVTFYSGFRVLIGIVMTIIFILAIIYGHK
jgi:hypothetical protein